MIIRLFRRRKKGVCLKRRNGLFVQGIEGIRVADNTVYSQSFTSLIGDKPVEDINIEMNRFVNSTPANGLALFNLYNVVNYSIHLNTFKDSAEQIIILPALTEITNTSTFSTGSIYKNIVTHKNNATTYFVHKYSGGSPSTTVDVRNNDIPIGCTIDI